MIVGAVQRCLLLQASRNFPHGKGNHCQPAPRRTPLKYSTPWKGLMLEPCVKCSLWEGFLLEKSMEDCLMWVEPHAGAGKECEEFPWGGKSGRGNIWWTDHSPHSPSHHVAGVGRRQRKWRIKLSLEKNMWGIFFFFQLTCHKFGLSWRQSKAKQKLD